MFDKIWNIYAADKDRQNEKRASIQEVNEYFFSFFYTRR